jgi:hypothetical protein
MILTFKDKPPQFLDASAEWGWSGYKLMVNIELKDGRELIFHFESKLETVNPKASYIKLLSPTGETINVDPCTVTRIWGE